MIRPLRNQLTINVLFIVLFFFMAFSPLQDKLEIINADAMRGEKTTDGIVRFMEGNIHLKQGEAQLFCQLVTWYVDLHKTVLEKDVRFVEGTKTISAHKVIYFDETRIVRAIGDVVIIDSLNKLTADNAIYYEIEDKIIADDNITVSDNENLVVLTGDHGEFFSEQEYALVTGEPVLTKVDSAGDEEIRVTGTKMELFKGGEQAVVSQNVNINHKGGKAIADTAKYFKDDNRLLLTGNPEVWQKFDKLTGDEIELFFADNKLHKVIITKNALVSSRVDTTIEDSRLNKLFGNKIILNISDNRLKEVTVEGKATCYYYIVEKDEYKGLNKIIGDKITMNLEQGKIQSIMIKSEPGSSSGIYCPPGFENKAI